MAEEKGIVEHVRELFDRRRFLKDSAGVFLASLVGPSFLRPFTTVRRVEETGAGETAPEKKKTRAMRRKASAKDVKIDPLFRPFLGEKLVYDVNFLWTIRAAEVVVTFRQGLGEEIVGTLEAKAKGVVGWATNMRRQVFKSRLVVRVFDGKKRLLSTNFSHLSENTKRVKKTLHRFNYEKRRRYYRKYINGKLKKKRTKKIPSHVKYYEDFVGLAYNVRAGVYGDMPPGKTIKIHTVPYKGIDEYTLRIATKKEMKEEKKWIGRHPDAKYMGIVKIHQKIFGLKTGEGKVLADKGFLPIAGKVKDAVSFGDVSTKLAKRSKIKG